VSSHHEFISATVPVPSSNCISVCVCVVCSEFNGGCGLANNVEVLFPESNVVGSASGSASVPPVALNADSTGPVSALSAATDCKTLVEKAIIALPPELSAQENGPKRKARSHDPGWQFGWWPDTIKKDFVQCVFCKKIVLSGIKRFKQHLAGGFGDTMKCARVPELVSKEMHTYLRRNMRVVITADGDEGEEEGEQIDVRPLPSSRTKTKQAKKQISQASMSSFVVSAPIKPNTKKASKSVSAMLCKTPEEVVAERHKNKTSQATLEHCSKKGTEVKQIVDDHVADFLYENKIPLNVVNSRSWQIMMESIGQYGPGYRGPSYYEARVPWLERAVKRTSTLRAKHEEA
jgi:hypothetical protein